MAYHITYNYVYFKPIQRNLSKADILRTTRQDTLETRHPSLGLWYTLGVTRHPWDYNTALGRQDTLGTTRHSWNYNTPLELHYTLGTTLHPWDYNTPLGVQYTLRTTLHPWDYNTPLVRSDTLETGLQYTLGTTIHPWNYITLLGLQYTLGETRHPSLGLQSRNLTLLHKDMGECVELNKTFTTFKFEPMLIPRLSSS
jgi:hypothetical protein